MTTAIEAEAQHRRPTPGMLLGPYYPVALVGDADSDPWNHAIAAPADPICLEGRIVTIHGMPVDAARVEIWHADSAGRYRHPHAPRQMELSAAFRGHGARTTSADGRWCFRTAKPGPYADGERFRAPHVHVQVTTSTLRVVTQLFFPADPRNAADRLLAGTRDPGTLLARPISTRHGERRFEWDIVVPCTDQTRGD